MLEGGGGAPYLGGGAWFPVCLSLYTSVCVGLPDCLVLLQYGEESFLFSVMRRFLSKSSLQAGTFYVYERFSLLPVRSICPMPVQLALDG